MGGWEVEGRVDAQIGTLVPSTGKYWVKKATSGGAPWKVI